ncbi:hypothetical protein BU14_0033s0074 [Porphyra umbilicalis]|uniref:Uncharacterized protein n=1 Tax=Porphyra umbilicalis TaxID=2786 RepID=A0A1X6PIR5_PORUM|nr:hypothetical protein BU14_0033s0074 [Porphyra umbilicalis]|eukprot:OSX80730.1 hypothetical protein BU14_0033s0074 [Porphyra umbilicalis]
MRRAVCAVLLNRGIEPVLLGLFGKQPPAEAQERIIDGLSASAREYDRGEVWPLSGIFGVLSRFPAGLVDAGRSKLTPMVVTTWLTESGTVACSCVGRVAYVARHGKPPTDASCQHARTICGAIDPVSSRLGVSLSTFRRLMPRQFGNDGAERGGEKTAATSSDRAEDWDAESPIKAFRTGQAAAAVVLSGTASCRVPAPVKCTRKTSSCEFCDSAAGFWCVHAVRARSVRRGDAPKEPLANDGGADGGVADDGAAIDDAQSTLPLPLYNCPRSMRTDIKVCRAMEEGEVVVLEVPSSFPTCGSKRTKGNTKVDKGEVLCILGNAAMSMQSFYCDVEDCQRWIFPDGRDAGLVILSCTTASTLVIMRDMTREMAASGCTFRSRYVHWVGKFLDRRNSGAFPDMSSVKMRSRKTIESIFFLKLQLMTKEPPLWAFKCATCQD